MSKITSTEQDTKPKVETGVKTSNVIECAERSERQATLHERENHYLDRQANDIEIIRKNRRTGDVTQKRKLLVYVVLVPRSQGTTNKHGEGNENRKRTSAQGQTAADGKNEKVVQGQDTSQVSIKNRAIHTRCS